ncbi:MAG: hypothetical protein KAT65_24685 [Methanophagales archaeon]|nr:hypothetical protein [Methanophagales archaeon]
MKKNKSSTGSGEKGGKKQIARCLFALGAIGIILLASPVGAIVWDGVHITLTYIEYKGTVTLTIIQRYVLEFFSYGHGVYEWDFCRLEWWIWNYERIVITTFQSVTYHIFNVYYVDPPAGQCPDPDAYYPVYSVFVHSTNNDRTNLTGFPVGALNTSSDVTFETRLGREYRNYAADIQITTVGNLVNILPNGSDFSMFSNADPGSEVLVASASILGSEFMKCECWEEVPAITPLSFLLALLSLLGLAAVAMRKMYKR